MRLIPSRFLRRLRPMTNALDVLQEMRRLPVAGLEALTGELREEEVRAAVAELGVPSSSLSFLRLPDGRAPHRGPAFVRAAATLTGLARSEGVRTVCATWQHDPHPDHLATYRLGRAVAAALGIRLLCYPVWGWTLSARTWLPRGRLDGFRIDIGARLEAKRRAVVCHHSQIPGLIDDDPGGFTMSHEFRSIFDQPYETFLRS